MKFRELPPSEMQAFDAKLKACKTFGELLETLNAEFDLHAIEMGIITKTTYITNLKKALNGFNPNKK